MKKLPLKVILTISAVLIVLCGLILLSCAKDPAQIVYDNPFDLNNPDYGQIFGQVRNALNGSVIAGADVFAPDGMTVKSDDDGDYILAVPAEQRIFVIVYAPGFQPDSVQVQVTAGDRRRHDFALYTTAQPGRVFGRVTRGLADTPIEGAVVSSNDVSTTTDSDGNYELFLAPGPKILAVAKHGFIPRLRWENIEPDGEHLQDFSIVQMDNERAVVFGITRDISNGSSISDVTITPERGETVTSNNDGFYISQVNSGGQTISISHPAFIYEERQVNLNIGNSQLLVINMTPASGIGYVYGNVSDLDSDTPLAGATISSDDGISVTTDELGDYSMDVNAGYRTITASLEGYFDDSQQLNVVEDGDHELDFELNPTDIPTGTVYGVIYDDDSGNPVPYADVWTDGIPVVEANEIGEYSIQVPVGDRDIYCISDGYYENSEYVYVEEGGNHNLEIYLDPITGNVWGRVSDPDGFPVPNATIITDGNESAITNSDGEYGFDVMIGSREFIATKPGWDTDQHFVEVTEYGDHQLNFELVPDTPRGMIEGLVLDCLTGDPIPGMDIDCDDGSYTMSDGSGYFSFRADEGMRQLWISGDGYYDMYDEFYLPSNENMYKKVTMSAEMGEDAWGWRFVLNWWEYPTQIDQRLVTPDIEGTVYVVDFVNQGSPDTPPYATLDRWDHSGQGQSHGPATMTIHDVYNGQYKYYIWNYSNNAPIAGSDAWVHVFSEYGLEATYSVPYEGDGRFWYVCDIIDDELHERNWVQVQEP